MAKVIQKKINTDVGVEFTLEDLLGYVDLGEYVANMGLDYLYDPCWGGVDDFMSQFEVKVGKEVIPLNKVKISFIDATKTGEA